MSPVDHVAAVDRHSLDGVNDRNGLQSGVAPQAPLGEDPMSAFSLKGEERPEAAAHNHTRDATDGNGFSGKVPKLESHLAMEVHSHGQLHIGGQYDRPLGREDIILPAAELRLFSAFRGFP